MLISKAKKFNSPNLIKKHYDKYGWVSLKNYIKKTEIDLIQHELDCFYKLNAKKKCLEALIFLDKKNKKKLYNLHTISNKLNSIKKVLSRISIIQTILLNKKDIPIIEIASGYMISLPRDKRLVYDFHQESNYMPNFSDILNIHFPIFHQSNIKNGTMSVLSKSHKLKNLKYIKKRISNNSYTNLIPSNIEKIKKNFDEIHLELNVGDVVFFHKDLIHKSNYNLTKTCRPVGIGRYTSSIGNFKILKPEDY